MTYSPYQWEKLNEYKDDIVNCCERCGGHGYVDDGDPCDCMIVFKYISKLFVAGIPSEYWNFWLDDLEVDEDTVGLIKKYFEYFPNAVKKHKGIMFAGTNGTGKTALMCEIGKYAISERYKVVFFTFEEFIQATHDRDADFFNKLKLADIHLFDEFGKGYVKEGSFFIPAKIEQYIKRTIADKVLIITTNYTEDELAEDLGDSIVSAIQRQIVTVTVNGPDYSTERRKDWTEDLKTAYDYYHANILRYAIKFRGRE